MRALAFRTHQFQLFLVAMVVALLMGCAAIGQQQAQSPQDGLQYAKATLTGVYNTIADAAVSKSLPQASLESYLKRTKEAERDVVAAEKIIDGPIGGDMSTAQGKLRAGLAALQLIATELRARLPAAASTTLVPAPK